MRSIIVALCLCIPTAFAGCSDTSVPDTEPLLKTTETNGTERPEEVARAFFESSKAEDVEAFLTCLTETARQGMELNPNFRLNGEEYESFEVGSAVVTENNAKVPVDVVKGGQDQKMNLHMRLENNAWRIHSLGMALATGNEITMDFEMIGSILKSMPKNEDETI